MNVLSLFSGVGGLDLGLERAGMRVVGHVEQDAYCRQVLAKHWPDVPQHDDVTTAGVWWSSQERPHVDLVAGGFPCQPVSVAGKGRAQADERWLWPAMADVVEQLRPEWVLWENVPGLRRRGLDLVHADLVRLGYRHRVGSLRACEVGAPHSRARLFGVAHAPSLRRREGWPWGSAGEATHRGNLAAPRMAEHTPSADHWANEPSMGRLVDGIPPGLAARQLRALGNAVVPQAAEHIGRLVMEAAA